MLNTRLSNLKMIVITFVITLGFSISLQSLLAAWTDPTDIAPGNNAAAPLNVSNVGQSKNSGLILNAGGISAYGLIVRSGNVGIGTISPSYAKLQVEGSTTPYNLDSGIISAQVSGTSKRVNVGYDTTLDAGYIQSVHSGIGNRPLLLNANGGNVGIGTTSPSTALDIGQNKALRIGNAYLSSGGNFAHLANNEWYNGAAWQTNGMPGALLQLNGQSMVVYNHNGAGGHTAEAVINSSGLTVYGNISATGDICGGGKCLSSAGVGNVSTPGYYCSFAWNEGAGQKYYNIGVHKYCGVGYFLHDGTQGAWCDVNTTGGNNWYITCDKWMGGGINCRANCID